MGSWSWFEIIQSVTGLLTVLVAFLALHTWKAQHKAEKVTSFLDELTDVIHEYVQTISAPIQKLQFIQIAIDSYKFDTHLNKELTFPEAVAFIEREGKEESAEFKRLLDKCSAPVAKIRSLAVKGQIFGLKDYGKCFEACEMLAWQYDRIHAFSTFIGSSNKVWENEDVLRLMGKILELDHEDVSERISHNQVEYLRFVKDTYGRLYKHA